jgi:hypothetical protein
MPRRLRHHHDGHSEPQGATRRAFLSSLISAAVFAPWALGQEPSGAEMAERFHRISEDFEREAPSRASPPTGP